MSVRNIGDDMRQKLAKAGFDVAGHKSVPLGQFLEKYIVGRKEIAESTVENFRATQANLVGFFGADRALRSVMPGDADDFRSWLLANYATAIANRRVRRAKQFFTAAVRRSYVARSPFAHVKAGASENRERMRYVKRDLIAQVLDACPDSQWRLIVALSRYGGLRCPSEHLALKWGHVLWDEEKLIVDRKKTKRRVLPIFPELRPPLEAVFDEAEEGSEYVITRYRGGATNLRPQFKRIIAQAGVEPWEKPFQNLRASRETELVEEFPINVVCAWIGNSPRVAERQYLQLTEEHYRKAVERAAVEKATHECTSNRTYPVAHNTSQCVTAGCEKP